MVVLFLLGGRGETEEPRSELVEVTRSRARLVDAFQTERRRIERDLHDGAQQRLISLAMRLDLARVDAPAGSGMERTLSQVHGQAKEIIGSLREIVQGIHPKVLSDRGLVAALPELADRSPVPTRVRVDLPRRPPAHLESAAYYVAAESLTNILAKLDLPPAGARRGPSRHGGPDLPAPTTGLSGPTRRGRSRTRVRDRPRQACSTRRQATAPSRSAKRSARRRRASSGSRTGAAVSNCLV